MKLLFLLTSMFITFAAIVTVTQGLQCYECVYGGNLEEEFPDQYTKKCEKGKLDSKYSKICDRPRVSDALSTKPINSSEFEPPTQYRCIKAFFERNGEVLTQKGCDRFIYEDEPDKVDRCYPTVIIGIPMTRCDCYSDKCNSGNSLRVTAFMVITSVTAIIISKTYQS